MVLSWWDDFLRDYRYGLRSLRRTPQASFAAILSLGLAVGVNTAICAVCRAVVWSEITAQDPAVLVRVKLAR